MNAASINGEMPASPVDCAWSDSGIPTHGAQTNNGTGWTTGLTKRELFAAMAMQGILGNAYWNEHGDYTPVDVAKSARDYADALLAELTKDGAP